MNTSDSDGAHGMVWLKCRNYSTTSNSYNMYDTVRGSGKFLVTSSNAAEYNLNTYYSGYGLTGFTGTDNDGFTVGSNWAGENRGAVGYNPAGAQLAWSFKCSPKFFDIVQFQGSTWSGTGARTPTIAHNLGTTPGFMIIKRYSGGTGDWHVYHTALDGGDYRRLELNNTDKQQPTSAPNSISYFASNSTHFDFNGGQIGGAGYDMMAYLFAEDGDNIKCGASTSAGGASDWNTVELGWEPQWIMLKAVDSPAGWQVCDTERDIRTGSTDEIAEVNTTATTHYGDIFELYSTGFKYRTGYVGSGIKFAYVAIKKEE